jgi:hypothetical protein
MRILDMTYRTIFAKACACFFLVLAVIPGLSSACTISEDMSDSLALNQSDIPNADRLKLAEMVHAARMWPDAEIRGIVYAGGYVKERDPEGIAKARAEKLRAYLLQLGLKEENIWTDLRTIKRPDSNFNGEKSLNQIAVSLVPICEGGCDRLCNDSRVTPNSRAIQ